MNLNARLRKLESVIGDGDGHIVIWSGITDRSFPQGCVYHGQEYEPITSTVEEAAQRLAQRVTATGRPMLVLVNKGMSDRTGETTSR